MMSIRAEKLLPRAGVLLALAGVGVAAGCGDTFADCRDARSCGGPDAAGSSEDAADGGERSGGAGSDANSNAGDTSGELGTGEGGTAGAGMLPPELCESAEDCDDGDGSNGAETCDAAGVCEAGNPPPYVVSVTPEADATGVERVPTVVITFSEPLDPGTVNTKTVKLLDGETVINCVFKYEAAKASCTVAIPLDLLGTYEVSVSADIKDLDGARLLEDYATKFTVRDGIWETVDVFEGDIYQVAGTLPVDYWGFALPSWIRISNGHNYCPTSTRFFFGSQPYQDLVELTTGDVQDCRSVAAGANEEVAAVAWQENAEYVQQFRFQAWGVGKPQVSNFGGTSMFAVGVSPDNSISLLQQSAGVGTYARRTDADGIWLGSAVNIGAGHLPLSVAQIGYDADGNGLAVWRAELATKEEVVAARYTAASGWEQAAALPQSVVYPKATGQRGVPAIAVAPNGDAMAVWAMSSATDTKLMASAFTNGAWGNGVKISGLGEVDNLLDAPGVAFDGQTFVAAWLGRDGGDSLVYSNRYDRALSQWGNAEPRTEGKVLERMPKLGADHRGNLLMTWLEADAAGGQLVYTRYAAQSGGWTVPADVPGGAVHDPIIGSGHDTPLGVATGSGLGAVMWGDNYANAQFTKVRLASFY
jgi:hypothetical protein